VSGTAWHDIVPGMIMKPARSLLPGLAWCCALLCTACPYFESQPDRKAALEALDSLGSLDLAIVYQPLKGGLWPLPVASALHGNDMGRLRLKLDGQEYRLTPDSFMIAMPIPAESNQILELFWNGSLIWKGSSTARPAPADLSCTPDYGSWLVDKNSTIAVSWQPIQGTNTYECRLVTSKNYLTEFPQDSACIWNGTQATLWWTAIPDSPAGPFLSVRTLDSAVMIEDEARTGRFTLRIFGAAAYRGADIAQEGNP